MATPAIAATFTLSRGDTELTPDVLRVAICGSFRRDLTALRRDYEAVAEAGGHVLTPSSLDFVAEEDGFVLLQHEIGEEPGAIEARHLAALRESDLVWLHAPSGYVGPSGALELGVAHMAGIPIYGRDEPADLALRPFVIVVGSVQDAHDEVRSRLPERAGVGLQPLQAYYARAAARRGWGEETAAESMLLLTEEVGELARAVRKSAGLARHDPTSFGDAAEELADIQLYLVHLANVLQIDLARAVSEKEHRNAQRARVQVAA